jgi:hypothetical protein
MHRDEAFGSVQIEVSPPTEVKTPKKDPSKLDYLNVALTTGIFLMSTLGGLLMVL